MGLAHLGRKDKEPGKDAAITLSAVECYRLSCILGFRQLEGRIRPVPAGIQQIWRNQNVLERRGWHTYLIHNLPGRRSTLVYPRLDVLYHRNAFGFPVRAQDRIHRDHRNVHPISCIPQDSSRRVGVLCNRLVLASAGKEYRGMDTTVQRLALWPCWMLSNSDLLSSRLIRLLVSFLQVSIPRIRYCRFFLSGSRFAQEQSDPRCSFSGRKQFFHFCRP